MGETVLKVEGLSKKYYKGARGSGQLRNELSGWFGGLWRGRSKEEEAYYALKDISFELKKGQVMGVIGKNGAGKSTLLKILSKITPPTSGSVEYSGRVTSILNVGTGFHPDLSGRENIYLNGRILGMSNTEITKNFDEIVDFSGVEAFIDTPIKHYSAGMYLRLAFSVAFHSDIDILLLDEVISVGDSEFRMKSFNRIQSMTESGVTIMVVSHAMNDLIGFCNRCMLLDQGKMVQIGAPMEVIEAYMTKTYEKLGSTQVGGKGPGLKESRVKEIRIQAFGKQPSAPIYMTDEIELEFFIEKETEKGSLELTFNLYDMSGVQLAVDSIGLHPDYVTENLPAGLYLFSCIIPANLLNRGVYSLNISLSENRKTLIESKLNAASFRVLIHPDDELGKIHSMIGSSLRPHFNWKRSRI